MERISMKNIVYEYLKYGFVRPAVDKFYKRKIYEPEEIEFQLNSIISKVIEQHIPYPDEVMFQLSGGFDSTLVASYFKNINTFCVSHKKSPDIEYSKYVSNRFNTKHTVITEEELMRDINIRDTLITLQTKVNIHPRGYINDIYLFHTLKHLKYSGVKSIAGGEGTELLFIGYMDMFQRFIELMMAKGDYKNKVANLYYTNVLKHSHPVNFQNVLKMSSRILYLSVIDWWTSSFTDNEIYRLIGDDEITYPNMNAHDTISYVWETLGMEYYYDRQKSFSDYFGIEWISPFTNREFVKYAMSLPIESKYCIKYPKHIFYETFRYRVPNKIYSRPKVGLFLSDRFFLSKKNEIMSLTDEFLSDKNLSIFNYLDFEIIQTLIEKYDFHKIWSLLNLSMWMELNTWN